MKKIFSGIFGFIIGLSALLISFLPLKSSVNKQSFADSEISFEAKYYDDTTQELVPKNPTGLISASADKTPFDPELRQRMEGYSITPDADVYGQVNGFSYSLNEGNGYIPKEDDNILVWVYLLDALTFKLEISLRNSSTKTLTWIFDSMRVYDMGTGWKLLCLKLSDFKNEITSSESYSNIYFRYFSELSEYEQDYEKSYRSLPR